MENPTWEAKNPTWDVENSAWDVENPTWEVENDNVQAMNGLHVVVVFCLKHWFQRPKSNIMEKQESTPLGEEQDAGRIGAIDLVKEPKESCKEHFFLPPYVCS